jgi:hypothetical protein
MAEGGGEHGQHERYAEAMAAGLSLAGCQVEHTCPCTQAYHLNSGPLASCCWRQDTGTTLVLDDKL